MAVFHYLNVFVKSFLSSSILINKRLMGYIAPLKSFPSNKQAWIKLIIPAWIIITIRSLSLIQFGKPFTQRCFLPILTKIGQVIQRKMYLYFVAMISFWKKVELHGHLNITQGCLVPNLTEFISPVVLKSI